MDAIFLGTSSGTPTRDRNVSGGALRFDDGTVWIIDCGEGTQHRILESDIKPSRIAAILITHVHGDHCYGLPGLLASLAVHERQQPVVVVGPPGIKAWWQATARFSSLRPGYPLTVVEWKAEGVIAELSAPATVATVPLAHRVDSVAFVIREPVRRGRVDAVRAAGLGVSGPPLGRLAAGETVTVDGATITPDQVIGPSRPGRHIVWCGDSSDSSALARVANDCDLLVHECTYGADREAAAREWGHSTTAMVAAIAKQVQPRQLALTHFSSRYSGGDSATTVADLQQEVEQRCPGVAVTMAHDLQALSIPPREK